MVNPRQLWKRPFFIPPPRAPVTWRTCLPLLLFAVIFAGVCLGLEWSHRLTFARPAALAIALSGAWIWWLHVVGRGGLGRIRGAISLAIRLALAGLFAMLLADPRAVRTSDALSVVYTLDISDSIGEQSTDAALKFVTKTVAEKPPKDEAGLIVFARDAGVELPPRITFPLEAINSRIERDATNLAKSLSLAAAMLPEQNRGRIVLITDGMQTEGALDPVLADLRSRDIAVDVLPIEYQYDHEVWLERLELPRFVKLGENYEATILLSSLQTGSGTLTLTENGQQIYREEISYQSGKNRYVIPIFLRDPGYYEYEATIEAPRGRDFLRENNTAINYIYIEGQGRVLLLHDPQGNPQDWTTLAETLRAGQRDVEIRTAFELPRDTLSLMPYDCVILANVPADALDSVQMQALRDAVYDLGIGLLMVGGDNSFGPGGYHRSPIEEALPVSMDISQKKILPKGGLVIVLHTCEFPEGNTWGKRIAKQAIKVLGEQDEAGILVYSTGEEWLFKLTPVKEYESMVTKINGATIGDMPSFAATMEMGLAELKASDAASKHMIIISDGDPQPPTPKLIQDFVDSKVTVSMVAIFPHGGHEISTMRNIAGATGGRYYFPDDPDQLPSIFIKEAKTLKRSMIQNETVQPEVAFPSPIIKGIDAVPPLHGYVLATAKPRSTTILQTTKVEGGEEQIDPILSVWRFGLGSTAAFMSDLSPNWGMDWIGWDHFRAIVTQLITQTSRVRKETHLRLWTYLQGNEGVIVAEDFHPQEQFLEIEARVAGPREQAQTVKLRQTGPRRYQATVPLWGKGRYQVVAAAAAGNRADRAYGGFILPYSPEYLRFRSNPLILNQIAEQTAGTRLPGDADGQDIFGRRAAKISTRQIFDWFLIGLACLIPLDVAVRRIQFDWWVIRQWFGVGRRDGGSSATMGTLLQRKKSIEQQLSGQRPAQVLQRPRAAPVAPPPPPPVAEPPAETGKSVDLSTTERLLKLKRERKDE